VPQSTEDIFNRAKTLAKDADDNFLDLARTLRQLKNRDLKLYQDLIKKTALGSRKAYYMIEVLDTYEPLPVPRARMRKLGWTKCQIMGKYITRDNWEELFALAENTPAKVLEKTLKDGKAKPPEDTHCVLMYLSPAQYKLFEDTLLENGATRSGRGLIDKEEALTHAMKKAMKAGKGGDEAGAG